MSEHKVEDYDFLGLCANGKPLGTVTSLGYLVGLMDSTSNLMASPEKAGRMIGWICDIEEQVKDGADLVNSVAERLPGYLPQTPVMLTKSWSPIGEMLEHNLQPLLLSRRSRIRSTATGVSQPMGVPFVTTVENAVTQEALFWAILSEVSKRATQRQLLVSVIACPGWMYKEPASCRTG